MAPFPESSILTIDSLVRSIGVNRTAPHAVFLGAGASITSGIPLANQCIWRWKQRIFLTRNPGLEAFHGDVSLVSTQTAIQRWLDNERTFPALWSNEEYSFYAESCFPIAEDRRRFFQELVASAKPFVGYQLLCILAEAGLIKQAWTVNFDSLVARTLQQTTNSLTAIEIGLDSANRSNRMQQADELFCVALHGDYRYDSLKNTTEELRKQDESMRELLASSMTDTNLIVIGYSGRDQTVMESLLAAYQRNGSGRLYWCGHGDSEPANPIKDLIISAKQHGREAFYIPTSGFDDLMVRLSAHCLSGELASRAGALRLKASSAIHLSPFSINAGESNTIIKSNAFPIECPSEVLQFESSAFQTSGAWKLLREDVFDTDVVAGLQRGKVLAFGTLDDIKDAFGAKISGPIERSPIATSECNNNGVISSMLLETITKAIAKTKALQHDGRNTLWVKAPAESHTVGTEKCKVYKAARLFLRQYNGKQYLVVKPTIKAKRLDGNDVTEATAKELKRLILTKQWNKQFNSELNDWRNKLIQEGGEDFEFPPNTGSSFRFKIKRQPIIAKICSQQVVQPNNTSKREEHASYQGMQYSEPALLFANHDGSGVVKDTHPIRGIRNNRPYDFALSSQPLTSDIKVGIVCPEADATKLAAYLQAIDQPKSSTSKQEYLLDYPGFHKAFNIPIALPLPDSGLWARCPEPGAGSAKERALQLARNIVQSIDCLRAKNLPNVIIVYIPERWRDLNEFRSDDERFDLHDFVKAHCVQNGTTTQFLREHTLTKQYQCEILWWLALSLYTKSMRTPWILEAEDNDTAYVGLGFSLDKTPTGTEVLVGCSHIYGASGLGLGYRLSKVENPVIRQGNPFMSRDDARRIGENTRQLFYDSRGKLPKRVVIHKRTPFLPDERDGLLEGLNGVGIIEMLEITVDPAMRFVAGDFKKKEADNYPIRRGTVVLLDERRLLLWVHGSADAVMPGKTYYQGKSRIPAPLLITRHHGVSPVSTIVHEILGLSKMSWNTFDMYTKLPATIESSGEIARIGSLLQRFGDITYDYRLFI